MSPKNRISDGSGPRAHRSSDRDAAPRRKPGGDAAPRSRREEKEGRAQGERRSGQNRAQNQDSARRAPRKPEGRSPYAREESGKRPFRKAEEGRQTPGARPAQQERPRGGRFLTSPWPAGAPLFASLSAETRNILEALPEALNKVWPLNAAHRRSLPEDVEQLSRLLTTERAGLARPYWSSPASISAYLYYFLPWNLVRLTRLLATLPLPDPRAAAPQNGEALLIDVGSGPLTLPLALWLARPQWRSAPLQVLALDTSSQPLELGRALMEALGALTGQPVWPVRTARAPLNQAARQAAPLLAGGRMRPWLVSAANVLNELRFGKKRVRGGGAMEDDGFDAEDEALDADFDAGAVDGGDEEKPEGCREERLEGFLESLSPLFGHAAPGGSAAADPAVAEGPALLFVEPGTRLGGTTIMRLRQLAVDGGLTALAPCTHQHDCPLLRGQGGRTWCHFTFGSEGAPQWLEALSLDAGLGKSGLSLSPLLLAALPDADSSASPQAKPVGAVAGAGLPARVLSAPFDVPGLVGRARYACSGKGLLLLENAEAMASGDALAVPVPSGGRRDRKSGALLASPPDGNSGGERRQGTLHEQTDHDQRGRKSSNPEHAGQARPDGARREREQSGREQSGREKSGRERQGGENRNHDAKFRRDSADNGSQHRHNGHGDERNSGRNTPRYGGDGPDKRGGRGKAPGGSRPFHKKTQRGK